MKRTIIILTISVLVLFTVILWIINDHYSGDIREIFMFSGIIIVVGFGLFFGIRRLISHKRNEPAEDEFSKQLITKTSSLSFYISIYFWLFIMYVSDKVKLESHTLIGLGIMGMALIFFFCWLGLRIFGLRK